MRALPLLALLVACGGGKGDDTGSLDPMLVGTVSATNEGASADFETYHAFGFDTAGKLLLYLSSNEDASCENVSDYLRVGQDPYDPGDVLAGGRCNMFVRLTDEYDGGLTASWTEGADGLDVIGASVSLECAMNTGEFALETRDDDDEDYYWSGRWWQGHPLTYAFDFSGGAGSDYTLDIEMSAYDGGFIYETFESKPATGQVQGVVTAEWCQTLGSTGLL